jgi:uncharacterized membrane protein
VIDSEASRGSRILRLLTLVIILKPVSNVLLAYGVHHFPSHLAWNPLLYAEAVFDPFVAAGVLMQIWWLLSRMALLSFADLSFVVPVTAAGYMLSSLLGKFFLHEILTPSRWMGIVLICIGSALAGGDRQNTTAGQARS